jgi:REP element-mobilizing transposase RayT
VKDTRRVIGASAFESSSAGVPPALPGTYNPSSQIKIRNRGKLPHWEMDNATYFLTFRLADSLPHSVLERLESEREAIIMTAHQLRRDLSADESRRIQQLSTPSIERFLDNGAGACHLRIPTVANAIAATLTHYNGQRYQLFAWCVMPNHVHAVVRFFPGHTLATVLHSWKSFSAKQANQILGLQGQFWQREYYDHLIRNEEEFWRALRYVADNPASANLKNWKWIWAAGEDAWTAAAEDGGATKPVLGVKAPLALGKASRAS